MLEVDAAFNILAGMLAFFLIRKGAVAAPVTRVEPGELHEILEADTAIS
jgi:hypothetical protein